jgi:release factor glutamine methyltransferase
MVNRPIHRTPEWTIGRLLAWVTDYFKTHQIDSPRSTAEMLLAHALDQPRIDLYLEFDKPLNRDELADFKSLMKRRLSGEPVAYIVGCKGFWTLDLTVTRDVLIPRPETECLVEAALTVLNGRVPAGDTDAPETVLDLGTGSGAVVIALATERPATDCYASDISVPAVRLARRNARATGLKDRVRFFAGSWFQPISPRKSAFHLIVSNPPYIRSGDLANLQREIRGFEPVIALDGSDDGLGCLRRIIQGASDHLASGGHLMLEIGYDQKNDVQRIIESCGRYEHIRFIRDFQGHDRVVSMQKK